MIPHTIGDCRPENRMNLTPRQKALTFQQPNERELKNEARWLYCWNLWKEIIRQQIEICNLDKVVDTAASGKKTLYSHEHDVKNNETKEALMTELQNHIVTKPVQTLSKVKTIRRIKEIRLKLEVWEKCRHEGVVFLSSLQIQACEYKTGERELDKENYKMIESFKQKVLDKIVVMCKNIDFYMKQLEEAIDIFKNHRSCGIFDPVVVKSIEKFNKRNSQPFVLPEFENKKVGDSSTSSSRESSSAATSENLLPSLNSKKRSSKSKRTTDGSKSSSHSTFVPDVPDFTEVLFVGWKHPQRNSESKSDQSTAGNAPSSAQDQNSDDGVLSTSTMLNTSDSNDCHNGTVIKEAIKRYLQILQQGTEWYFSWSSFTEKALKEIKSLAPTLGSEVLNYMTKHINRQINLLKDLLIEVQCIGDKTKGQSFDEMRVMATCLSVLDDFVNLIESIKHETSYLIRYVEIALINLGVLDLSKEPVKIQPLRLYLMRNVISHKDSQLLASIDYLYSEMGFLLEFIEFRFHRKQNYLEKFGQVTADLLKKYTVNRKEAIQEKEFMNIEYVNKLELAREICSTDESMAQLGGICKTPLSRYQRAEDLRKWVEDSKKMAMASKSTKGSTSVSMPLPTTATECVDEEVETLTAFQKMILAGNGDDSDLLSTIDPELDDMKGKELQRRNVSFWKSTKSSAHNLKKKFSLKRK